MPGQSANADCRRAPGRHLWFTDVIPGGPFATRAHASGVADNRMVFVHSNRSGWRMIDARVRHEWNSQARPGCRREMVRFAQNIKLQQMANRRCTSGSPVWISAFSHWLHRADTCTSCQASARFRPRTRLTRQLCTRSTPFHFNFADYISVPLRSDGRKLARQSGHKSCAPEDSKGRDAPHVGQVAIWPRDFVRPRHQQYGARLRLSPKARQ